MSPPTEQDRCRIENLLNAGLSPPVIARQAEETLVPELKTAAKTIRDRMEGITSCRAFEHFCKACMEVFNNTIRWLIRQAYGFRDMEYLKLKIYQLPEINPEKAL